MFSKQKKNCEVLMISEKSFWETGFDFFTKKKSGAPFEFGESYS